MGIDCSRLDPGAVIRPVPGECIRKLASVSKLIDDC
jgi:hypothetical protein